MMDISKKRLVVLAFSLVLGGWLGYGIGSALGIGGINAAFALGGIIFAALVLLFYGFIAILLAKQPDGTGGPMARATLTAAGMYATAFGGGWLGSLL